MLAQFVDQQKQNDWDTKLDKLTFAYNTAVHATTKLSPFELMFGRVPKLPIDLVYDQTDSEELKAKIEVEWIASEFAENLRKDMKEMFDFAASNRDAAALRASALVDRTVRGVNFQVGDKVWVLDQNTKKGVNPKLRPRWKGPYLVTGILNEVDAILKADGRSRKTLIVHFSKLKKCFGKPFIAPMNYQDQSIEESNLIDETEIEQSPASNSLTEKHRMERARKSEEDSSSDERQTQGRAQKEQPSQRNEEPVQNEDRIRREDIRKHNPHDQHKIK